MRKVYARSLTCTSEPLGCTKMRSRIPLARGARRMGMACPGGPLSRTTPPARWIRSNAEMSPPTNIGVRAASRGEAGAAPHPTSRATSALLACCRINGKCGSGGEGQMDGAGRVDDNRVCAQEVVVRPCRQCSRHGRVDRARAAVDGDEALVAPPKGDGVRAVVPPMID